MPRVETCSLTDPMVVNGRSQLSIDRLSTPIGELVIVCDEVALCAVDFAECHDRLHALLGRRYAAYDVVRAPNPLGVTESLECYFRGDLTALEAVCVHAGGTPYQRRVWSALRTIRAGQTHSYGQLAAQLGATHARAVGHASSLNPVAIVIPCHRVIGANATLTGYAGGLARKRWLLDHEARSTVPPLPLTATHEYPAPKRARGPNASDPDR